MVLGPMSLDLLASYGLRLATAFCFKSARRSKIEALLPDDVYRSHVRPPLRSRLNSGIHVPSQSPAYLAIKTRAVFADAMNA